MNIKPAKKEFFLHFTSLLFFFTTNIFGQECIQGKQQVCYGISSTVPQIEKAVKEWPSRVKSTSGKSQIVVSAPSSTSSFELELSNFPPEAEIALEHAVSTWQKTISSTVPIRIHANWSFLGFNQLASTGARKLYRNFPGAIQNDIWYPVALAEKIAGKELNDPTEADIEITINSNVGWYFGIDGASAADFAKMIRLLWRGPFSTSPFSC